jgi:Kef-type K+ transport system membrane component KefB
MASCRLLFGYLFLVGLPLLILVAVVNSGAPGPGNVTAPVPASPVGEPLISGGFLLVLQILVILTATRFAAAIFRRIGQAAVIGEMVAGVVLGPSLLGWLAPSFSAALFPQASLGHLEALSQIGLVLFMLVVGATLDIQSLGDHCHAAVLASHVSIAMPLLFGASVASLLYPDLAGPGVAFQPFALFMGAAMSITAFPVLARILRERRMLRSPVGTLAIACAAVDDVTGWCLLAYITVLTRASHSGVPIWLTVAGSVAFTAIMISVVRRRLEPLGRICQDETSADRVLAPVLVVTLLAALTTEFLGIHLLFGSFLAGAVMPKTPRFRAYLQDRVEAFCLTLLMPLFFALTGLRTNFGALRAGNLWPIFGLLLAVAIIGKLGGATVAARLAGFGWREAATVGSLLNTRGLMELVILNIGREVGILTPALFTLMVLMAILTTFMTVPLLSLLHSATFLPVPVPCEDAGPPIRRAPG